MFFFFFFQAEDGIRDGTVTGVQTCALPICREQRLAEAISHGTSGDAAPEALLSALRAEETRRKSLEEQLATLPESTVVVSLDRDRVARELRTRADDVRGVLRRQGAQAREEALRTLLVDRFDCTL